MDNNKTTGDRRAAFREAEKGGGRRRGGAGRQKCKTEIALKEGMGANKRKTRIEMTHQNQRIYKIKRSRRTNARYAGASTREIMDITMSDAGEEKGHTTQSKKKIHADEKGNKN